MYSLLPTVLVGRREEGEIHRTREGGCEFERWCTCAEAAVPRWDGCGGRGVSLALVFGTFVWRQCPSVASYVVFVTSYVFSDF